MRAAWQIDPDHLKRADQVPDQQVGTYLDSILTAMHIELDAWRFHKADPEALTLTLEALVALFVSAQNRGMA